MNNILKGQNNVYNNNGMPCVNYDNVIGIAPAAAIGLGPSRSPTYMSFDNNVRSYSDNNSVPLNGPVSLVPLTGAILNNYYVNETDRGEISPTVVTQINLKGSNQWNNLSFLDPQRTTTKETTEYQYAGNAQRSKDGQTFYSYDDAPKTTTKETTDYQYTGNAQRSKDGQTFYTYQDVPKATTKETTDYSFNGNIQQTIKSEVSRFQYTGPEESTYSKGQSAFSENGSNNSNRMSGGAKNYSLKSATLVQNWTPGAGRTNILLDPDASLGKIDFKGRDDFKVNGPGTFAQNIPNAARMQFNQIIAAPTPSANKLIGLDDRQIASYQVDQLKNNPLSIYTNNANGEIPNLYAYNAPNTYSSLSVAPKEKLVKRLNSQFTKEQIDTSGGIGNLYSNNVYPRNGDPKQVDTSNPVMAIFNGTGFNRNPGEEYYNPMLEQGSSNYYKEPEFSGHAYSGLFVNNSSKDNIYGPISTYRLKEPGDSGIESVLSVDGKQYVCEGNRALSYNVDDTYYDRNFY